MLSKYFVVNGVSTLEAVRKGSSDILTMWTHRKLSFHVGLGNQRKELWRVIQTLWCKGRKIICYIVYMSLVLCSKDVIIPNRFKISKLNYSRIHMYILI